MDQLLALLKKRNGEVYILIFNEASRADAGCELINWIDNPELSFFWDDYARLQAAVDES